MASEARAKDVVRAFRDLLEAFREIVRRVIKIRKENPSGFDAFIARRWDLFWSKATSEFSPEELGFLLKAVTAFIPSAGKPFDFATLSNEELVALERQLNEALANLEKILPKRGRLRRL